MKEGSVTEEETKEIRKSITDELDRAFEASKTHVFKQENWRTKEWEEIRVSPKFGNMKDTGVNID